MLFAWTGSHGKLASPCPCPCPLSQRCRWAQKQGRRSPGWVRASVLASATRPAVAPGPRRGRWRRRQDCWPRPLRPAVNNGRRRRRQGEAPLLPPNLFRARGGGGADTRLPEAAAPGAGPRDRLRRQPRSPCSAGGAGGAAAGATGERPHFLPACPCPGGAGARAGRAPRPPPVLSSDSEPRWRRRRALSSAMQAAQSTPSGGSPPAASSDTAAGTADSSGASGSAEPEWGPPPPPLGRRHSNKRFTGLKLFGRR